MLCDDFRQLIVHGFDHRLSVGIDVQVGVIIFQVKTHRGQTDDNFAEIFLLLEPMAGEK